MKNFALAALLITVSFLTGCGKGGDTAESVSVEITANMKEMASILTSVTDEASAKAAVPKINAVRAKMKDCGKRAKLVPKIDAETEKRIAQINEKDMNEAMASLGTARERLMAHPELVAILEPAMQNMEDDL